MANSLPMSLRVYQKLSATMVPMAPALIKSSTETWAGSLMARRWAMYLINGAYLRIMASRSAEGSGSEP